MTTLLIQNNGKLLEQLKSRSKRKTSWNKNQLKLSMLAQNQNLHYLVELSLQTANRIFALSFEEKTVRTRPVGYLPPIIDGQNFFDLAVKTDTRTYDKIATDQGDDHTTGSLLDYPYFKENYKVIANRSKQTTSTRR